MLWMPTDMFMRAFDLANVIEKPFLQPTSFLYFHIGKRKNRESDRVSGNWFIRDLNVACAVEREANLRASVRAISFSLRRLLSRSRCAGPAKNNRATSPTPSPCWPQVLTPCDRMFTGEVNPSIMHQKGLNANTFFDWIFLGKAYF